MFDHLDDPKPPTVDQETRERIHRRAARRRRRRRGLLATGATALVAAAGAVIAYAESPTGTHTVQVAAPRSSSSSSVSAGTVPASTLPVATTPSTRAPGPTASTVPVPKTTTVPSTSTTTVRSLRLDDSSNGQRYTVSLGSEIDVHLTPNPSGWTGVRTSDANSTVLREDSSRQFPDGSVSAVFTAIGTGGDELFAFHPCSNPPGGPAYCTQAISYIVYITVAS